jgi:glycine reductase
MSLELALYPTSRVEWGKPAGWSGGRLTMDRAALGARIVEASGLRDCRLELVRPGESVRVASVLDVVEPRCDERGEGFPGQLSPLQGAPRHSGRRQVVAGMKVIGVGQIPGVFENQYVGEAIADWAGPTARYNPFASDHGVVLECLFADGQPALEREDAARRAILTAALELARLTMGVEAPLSEHADLSEGAGAGRPRVAYICPVMTLTDIHRTFVYGRNVTEQPTWLPLEAMADGAVVSGNYDIGSTRNPTALYQRNPVLEALRGRHGRELDCVGLVVSKCLINGYAEKRASAAEAARLAQEHGAEGVIVGIEECGHAFADQMLTCSACEEIGLKTVLLLAESAGPEGDKPGALAFAAEADAVVSAGNMDEEVELPLVDRVLGRGAMEGRHKLTGSLSGPLRTGLDNLLAATTQTGALTLKAVDW